MTQEQLKAERRIASRSDPRPFVKQEWPYIAMLGAALVGVALESLTPQPMTLYWEILAPLFGIVCVFARLRDSQHQAALTRLVRIEALHWGAVVVAMRLVFVGDVPADGLGSIDIQLSGPLSPRGERKRKREWH